MRTARQTSRRAGLLALGAATLCAATSSQAELEYCPPAWTQAVFPRSASSNPISALATFDDGSGPALYVGGGFTSIAGITANRVAKWDGQRWSALGNGIAAAAFVSANVADMAVYDDDGPGPHAAALYVGGYFSIATGAPANWIAKWDGAQWSPLGAAGLNERVEALAVYDDDGEGPHLPALYVGGLFTTAAGATVNRIARWNGASWSDVGGGVTGPAAPGVMSLTVLDDGNGPALYVGGQFTTAGGVAVSNLARWNNLQWADVEGGVTGAPAGVRTLAAFDDDAEGPHPAALYVGGVFTAAGGVSANRIAKWEPGSPGQWSALNGGVTHTSATSTVDSLHVWDDDGAGGPHLPALYVTGAFTHAGGAPAISIAKWTGTQWSALGAGLSLSGVATGYALGSFDEDGAGSGAAALFVGGNFSSAGGVAAGNLARWNGAQWSWPDNPANASVNNAVSTFCVHDEDGPGAAQPGIYAAGGFTTAGGQSANRVAKWTADGWSALGSGLNSTVEALCAFTDIEGTALYAGGTFTTAGGSPANRIAKWKGAQWAPLDQTFNNGVNNTVYALLSFDDDGAGPLPAALYAAGAFTQAGGAPANRIARWNGLTWTTLGAGANGTINALVAFDDGAGPAIYAGGSFTQAGGVSGTANIARWTPGSPGSWSALLSGVNGAVEALAVFDDDGAGPHPPTLIAGGTFNSASGVTSSGVARWNGSQWFAMPGLNSTVRALAEFDDGSGPALYAGGSFGNAFAPPEKIAKWTGSTWVELGGGLDSIVEALVVFDEDGAGPRVPVLFVGGSFLLANDNVPGQYMARWGCQNGPGNLDGDAISTKDDNCPTRYNLSQSDCDHDLIGDLCQPGNTDCNDDNIVDRCDILAGTSADCTGNFVPDECEPDCNSNGRADSCDILIGASRDCGGNAIPDECEPDCNSNGVVDSCEVAIGQSADCNVNGRPDDCDIASGASVDCQTNGIPDECEREVQPQLARDAPLATWCQPPDLLSHGGAWMIETDPQQTLRAADGFAFAQDTVIRHASWWGSYRSACAASCGPFDDFTLVIHGNDAHGPAGTVLAEYHLGAVVNRTPTGNTIAMEGGYAEYQYEVDLPAPFVAAAGATYWLEVRNAVAYPCAWWWETAPPILTDVGLALRDTAGDGFGEGDTAPYDLAFCVSGLLRAADCNTNGLDDAAEIAGGTSQDCQSNGILDECEQDLNVNGRPDDCDIIDGLSRDLNFNGTPDEVDCLTRPGDMDGDCDVDSMDYAAFAACLDFAGPGISASCGCADLDLNGTVDVRDYVRFAVQAGTTDESCRVRPPDACPDNWATSGASGLRNEATFYDFGVHGPIPAGFFGDGSDAFGALVNLVGAAADPNGVHGNVDTQVEHGPVVFDSNGVASTSLSVVTLGLYSPDPITVTYGGANPEEWLVVVDLSAHDPGPGSLSATLDGPDSNAGTFDAVVYVQPVFTFIRVQDLIDNLLPECITIRLLDTGGSGDGRSAMPPITLTFDDQPFVRVANPEITSQVSVSSCAQGNFVVGVHEQQNGLRTAQLVTCQSHITNGEAHSFCPPECTGPDKWIYNKVGKTVIVAGPCDDIPGFPRAAIRDVRSSNPRPQVMLVAPCPGRGGMVMQFYDSPAGPFPASSLCRGACTRDADGKCMLLTNALCSDDDEFTYHNDGSRCDEIGACCVEGGPVRTTPEECANMHGLFQGSGSDFSACLGTCCTNSGSCLPLYQADCYAQSGRFKGIGNACADGPASCLGACCSGLNDCALGASGLCGGDYMGDGTTCTEGVCAGYCCVPPDGCTIASEQFCAEELRGHWLGGDESCGPGSCADQGACCNAQIGACFVSDSCPPGFELDPGANCDEGCYKFACCLNPGCINTTLEHCQLLNGTPGDTAETCETTENCSFMHP